MNFKHSPQASLWCWAALTTLAGLLILLAPGLLLSLLEPQDGALASTLLLVRLLGILLLAYAMGYWIAALFDDAPMIWGSIVLRAGVLPSTVAMVAMGWLPPGLLAIGVLDAAGALWTWSEWRKRGATLH